MLTFNSIAKLSSTAAASNVVAFCRATNTSYRYHASGAQYTINGKSIVIGGAGGDSRWIGVKGSFKYDPFTDTGGDDDALDVRRYPTVKTRAQLKSTSTSEGVIFFCVSLNTTYKFHTNQPNLTPNNSSILITGAGGDSRWVGTSGSQQYIKLEGAEVETTEGGVAHVGAEVISNAEDIAFLDVPDLYPPGVDSVEEALIDVKASVNTVSANSLLAINNLSDVADVSTALGNLGAEPTFSKNTAFNKNFGTGVTDVTIGNDSRLTNDRTTDGIRTATTVVAIGGVTAPSTGQILIATSPTAAAWSDNKIGDVVGPGVAIDDHIVLFNSTTGKLVKDSGIPVNAVNTLFNKYDNTGPPGSDDDGANSNLTGIFSVGSYWLDTVSGKMYVCTDNTTNDAKWSATTGTTGAVVNTIISASFTGNNTPYVIQTASATFTGFARMIFPGSVIVGTPSQILINIYRSSVPAATYDVRIIRIDNLAVIASITAETNTDPAVTRVLTVLANIPTTETIFEIQVRRNSGNPTIELSSLLIEF